MFKLSRRVSEGPSAVELIEASKKLYVKTEALKQTKIDVCGPRLFHKTASEEELAILYQNFAYNPMPPQLPLRNPPPPPRRPNVVRISPPSLPSSHYRQKEALQMYKSCPTSGEEGVTFCITSSTLSPPLPKPASSNWCAHEQQKRNHMNHRHQGTLYSNKRAKEVEDVLYPLKNGLSSAFQPVMVAKSACARGPIAVSSAAALLTPTPPPPIPPKSQELRSRMSQRKMFPRTSPMHAPPPLHPKRQKSFNEFDGIRPEASVNTTIELQCLDGQETAHVIVRTMAEEEQQEKRPVPPPRQSLRQRPIPPPRLLRRRQTTSDLDTAAAATASMSRSMYNPRRENISGDKENSDVAGTTKNSDEYTSIKMIPGWQSSQHDSTTQKPVLPSQNNPSSSFYSETTSDLNTAIQQLRMAVAAASGTSLNHPTTLNQQLEAAIAKRLAEIQQEQKQQEVEKAASSKTSTLISGKSEENNLMSMSCYGQLPALSTNTKSTKFDTLLNKPPKSEVSGSKGQKVTTFPVTSQGSPDSTSSSSTIVNASSNCLNSNSMGSSPTAYSSSRDSGHVSENGMSSGVSNTGSSLVSASAYSTNQGHPPTSLRKLKSRQLSPIGSALQPVIGRLDKGDDFEERVQRWESRNKGSKPKLEDASSSSFPSQQQQPSTSSNLTVTVFKDFSGPSSNGRASVSLPSPTKNHPKVNRSSQTPANKPNTNNLQAILSSSISSTDSKGLNEETLELLVELDRCQLISQNPRLEAAEEASALFFAEPATNFNEENDCSSSLIASSSIFTSISAVPNDSNAGSDEGTMPCSGIIKNNKEQEPKVVDKPVSQIEKTARVIQWIHGCTTVSDGKSGVAATTTTTTTC